MTYTISNDGLDLTKEFEGCELSAYPDPGSGGDPWTIGFGHTGPEVVPGLTITQEQADKYLEEDIRAFSNVVNKYATVAIKQCMFDALVSFTYNVGGDAFRNSTLLRLLNQHDYEGAAAQFDRWVNGANGPLPGLVRRRNAEEALFRRDGWLSEDTEEGSSEAELCPVDCTCDKCKSKCGCNCECCKKCSKCNPQVKPEKVVARVTALQDTVLKKEPVQSSQLDVDEKVGVSKGKTYSLVWVGQLGNDHVKVSLANKAGSWFVYAPHWKNLDAEKAPELSGGVNLDAGYFSQLDNYRDASRTCFSSSCAMLLEYMKPGTLPGSKGDDKYVQQVFQYGNTTDPYVQVKTLGYFGLQAKFVQNGSVELLKKSLDNGVIVPIGILIKGPASAPSGGGHWVVVKGYDSKGFFCHDPWGTLDHKTGQYISTDGENVHYSTEMIKSRWTVANSTDGWAIIV